MSSKFLGRIGSSQNCYEVHAFTTGLPFREFCTSEISDMNLFKKMIKGRYSLLAKRRSIFCTAVHPDPTRQIELNPHDTRNGSVHLVAINKQGNIGSALSVAVDTGEKDGGKTIGLPLENKWKRNSYPEGASLDKFRDTYLFLNYHLNKTIKPWQMAELYRHYKNPSEKSDIFSRLGLYIGCYHLLVKKAICDGQTPTTIWVFDAIAQFFHLYRFAGAAVLRNFTLYNPPIYLSPSRLDIQSRIANKYKHLFYRGISISRNVTVPVPVYLNNKLCFRKRDFPFLDGVIDIFKVESAMKRTPVLLSSLNYVGLNYRDRIKFRSTLSIIAKETFKEYYKDNPFIIHLNNLFLRLANVETHEFQL